MITGLTLTDADFQRPLTGDSAATSSDSADTESGGAFAAILAPMSVDGEATSTGADRQDSRSKEAPASSADGDSPEAQEHFGTTLTRPGTDGSDGIEEARLQPLAGMDAALELARDGQGDGNTGKILPPGGNDGQSAAAAASIGLETDLTTQDADHVLAGKVSEAIAATARPIDGTSTEAGGESRVPLGSAAQLQGETADPLVAAGAGTARAAGVNSVGPEAAAVDSDALEAATVEKSTANAIASGNASRNSAGQDGAAQDGAARDRSAAFSGDSGVLEGRNLSDTVRVASEAGPQARGGETVNTALNAGTGASADSTALPERGQVPGMTELRPGDRLLTERSAAELTTADRGPRLAMQQAVGQAGWGEEIQGKLQWLSRQGLQRAELQLHPAELGSIDVRITSENDQTSVVFVAANRTARELLEAEMPRLRELFSEAGVELGQAEVMDREAGDRQQLATGDDSYDSDHNSAVKQSTEQADSESGESNLLTVAGEDGRGTIDYYI